MTAVSIDHKVYLFRYSEFQSELADLLYHALETDEVGNLRGFINSERSLLTEHVTEEPLVEDWEVGFEPDVQRYADIALTKYYNLAEDLGLGYSFDVLGAYLNIVSELAGQSNVLICGRLFGPKGKRLDPGYMGTGLLPPDDVSHFAMLLSGIKYPAIPNQGSKIYSCCYYKPKSADEVQEALEQLNTIYQRAAQEKLGLLLLDFNDHGVNSQ